MVSPAQVARLHLARQYDPGQVAMFSKNFRETALSFDTEMRIFPPKWNELAYLRANVYAQGSWEWLDRWGKKVATWVIETRSIPPDKVKATEMAVRLFIKAARKPRDVVAWWAANKKHVFLLVEALDWPERDGSRETTELFQVGPFTVHNTLHLTGPKLAGVVDVLETSMKKIRAAAPSVLERVLYGEIFVVGQLKKSNTLAWYFQQDDRVYLRPHLKVGFGDVHNLIHELGHRYWFQFLPMSSKHAWQEHYRVLKHPMKIDVRMPQVGDLLDIPIRGHIGEEIRVEKIAPSPTGEMRIQTSTGGWIEYDRLRLILKEKAVRSTFPTEYAATDVGEYFADSFALHVLGALQEPHETWFIEAIG